MSDDEIVETLYGKYSKYEIVKQSGGVFTSTKFYIRRDGKPHRGPYSSLRAAVEVAEKESGDKR
jgi:hypothetical protein